MPQFLVGLRGGDQLGQVRQEFHLPLRVPKGYPSQLLFRKGESATRLVDEFRLERRRQHTAINLGFHQREDCLADLKALADWYAQLANGMPPINHRVGGRLQAADMQLAISPKNVGVFAGNCAIPGAGDTAMGIATDTDFLGLLQS